MMQGMQAQAPRISPLQEAWLQEIGLDKKMLARYVVLPAEKALADAPAVPAAATPGQQSSPAAKPVASSPAHGLQAAKDLLRMPAARPVTEPAEPSDTPVVSRQPMPSSWDALLDHISVCQACALHNGRSHAVAGTGVAQEPEWLIVGEAPGSVDDRTGLPFQGKAGQLLRAMLASIQVSEQVPVFYTNLIKCRPLGNRTPSQEEIAACLPYLQRQIALLKPKRILTLGGLAAQSILGVSDDLDDLRGRIHVFKCQETGREIPVVTTYHPTALLLRPQHKPDTWRDLALARSAVPAST